MSLSDTDEKKKREKLQQFLTVDQLNLFFFTFKPIHKVKRIHLHIYKYLSGLIEVNFKLVFYQKQ